MKDVPLNLFGAGHTLGGGGSGGNGGGSSGNDDGPTRQLTAAEIRERRLAALSGADNAAAPAAAAAASANHHSPANEPAAAYSAAAAAALSELTARKPPPPPPPQVSAPPERHVSFGTARPDDRHPGAMAYHHSGDDWNDGLMDAMSHAVSGAGGSSGNVGGTGNVGMDDEEAELQRALALSLMDSAAAGGGGGSILGDGNFPQEFPQEPSGRRQRLADRPPTPVCGAKGGGSNDHDGDRKPAAMDDDDGDRKPAAVSTAMSMSAGEPSGAAPRTTHEPPPPPQPQQQQQQQQQPITYESMTIQIHRSPERPVPSDHLRQFHDLMWNPTQTTPEDRERWRNQGVDTTPSLWEDGGGAVVEEGPAAASSASSSAAAAAAGDNGDEGDDDNNDDNDDATAATAATEDTEGSSGLLTRSPGSPASISMGGTASTAASSTVSASAVLAEGGGLGLGLGLGPSLAEGSVRVTTSAPINNNVPNDQKEGSSSTTTTTRSPIVDALGTQPGSWGLTQVHGGPCGVLAAVQAELLRMLLFGRVETTTTSGSSSRNVPDAGDGGVADGGGDDKADANANSGSDPMAIDDSDAAEESAAADKAGEEDSGGSSSNSDSNSSSSNGALHRIRYPLERIAAECSIVARTPPTQTDVQEALALAIGTILARAALVAPASVKEREVEREQREEGWVKVPSASSKRGSEASTKVDEEDYDDDSSSDGALRKVRIVLPAGAVVALDGSATDPSSDDPMEIDGSSSSSGYHGLTWEMLDADAASSAPANGNALCVCTVSITPENADEGPEIKRQRKNSCDGSDVVQCEASLEGRIACLASITANFLLGKSSAVPKRPLLHYFSGKGGVLLLVLSLLESRGASRTKSDMDDSASTLTSQFGHSSQELINLLLTGQAVSNVFDNSMELGGDVVCRGIQSQPAIGYLSQLEAMRYCEVGGYYKSPHFPIWVVGSTSHFSVLFGDKRCTVESISDVLLEKCRRAFRSVDGGEDGGFIQVSSLGEVIRKLDLQDTVGANGLQTLKASLEIHGAGIILWSDFWKAASRLLTGASLEAVLQGDGPTATKDKDQPLMLTQFGEGTASAAAAASSTAAAAASSAADTLLSDEELARKLAAEWGTDPGPSPSAAATAAPAASHNSDPRQKSDEELARELQAQWNADGDTIPDLEPITEIIMDPAPKAAGKKRGDDSEKEASNTATAAATLAEDDGNTFDLYHYNGLRGGTLTTFRVVRPKALDVVGSSITVSAHGGSASQNGGDLEDVVRTKWQQCKFDWLGKRPPFID